MYQLHHCDIRHIPFLPVVHMRIGIITNSDQFIPMAYTLANNNLQVCIFFKPGDDIFAHQKVDAFGKALQLPVVKEDVYRWVKAYAPDLVFVYGYPDLLDVTQFRQPVYNIHPGPLPSYRGPVPVFWQLKRGEQQLCVSIHVLTARYDAGKVVWEKWIPDQGHYNYGLVQQLFSQVVIEGVIAILNGQVMQVDANRFTARYDKRPVLQDVMIRWQEMSAKEICDLVRACNPWNKGAVTVFNGEEVKLMDAVVAGEPASGPGVIGEDGCIGTADGKLLRVNMFFMHEVFVPGYLARLHGLVKGKKFE